MQRQREQEEIYTRANEKPAIKRAVYFSQI